MKTRKLIALAVIGGTLMASLGSCITDLGFTLLNTLTTYLPDLIAAATGTTTG
jgi:hypothetical protein